MIDSLLSAGFLKGRYAKKECRPRQTVTLLVSKTCADPRDCSTAELLLVSLPPSEKTRRTWGGGTLRAVTEFLKSRQRPARPESFPPRLGAPLKKGKEEGKEGIRGRGTGGRGWLRYYFLL